MSNVVKTAFNGGWSEARRFILSALLATSILAIGEQAVLVTCAPIYFSSIGEWIWNLFVSTSFLWTLATIYAVGGGLCWQAVADHANLFDLLSKKLSLSKKDAEEDRLSAAWLAGLLAATGTGAALVYVLQLHFSTAYNNKALAALLFVAILFILAPAAVLVYALTRRVALYAGAILKRLIPNKLLGLELLLLVILFVLAIVFWTYSNLALFKIIDIRPWVIIGAFLLTHLLLYRFFTLPVGEEIASNLMGVFTIGGWLLLVGVMLATTILAYSSQPCVAGILRRYSPISKPIILSIQRIADRDKDGFSSVLLGGDCNDESALIHPMAFDIPGNMIDEDCMGGDARKISAISSKRDAETEKRIDSIRHPYNVLMITIDAARADHMSFMGYARNTTPELDELAAQSVVFERAYSQASNTPMSIPSFTSGMYPSQIFWDRYANFPKITNKTVPVWQRLKEEGYHTAGIFSYWYFDKRNLKRDADWWDTRAFRMRDHSERTTTDDLVTDNAIEYLERKPRDGQPLFLWLHYFDPHFLYKKHEGIFFGKKQMDLYDGELRFSSQQVGRFLDYFKKTSWYDSTIIILAADHGEEFKEHGNKYHGSQLYEESVHVPLLLKIPSIAHRRIDQPVGLIDIVPTIYDLIGINGEKTPVQGRSLAPLAVVGKDKARGPVYIEKLRSPTFPWSIQALVTQRWKLIHRANEQVFELYDLDNDNAERNNLWNSLPEKSDQMRLMLMEFRNRTLTNDTGWYRMASEH